MEKTAHDMASLFAQLGEPSDDWAIAAFIAMHSPLPSETRLHEATFWSREQARFLLDAITEDADWAVVVDELNCELHTQH